MGVGISAYATAGLVRAGSYSAFSDDELDQAYEDGSTLLYNLEAFRGRSDGMPDGLYRVGAPVDRWDSSYGGYNRWRRMLCMSVLGVPPETVWADYGAYESEPFAPLINFADNEGFLGPRTCRRLLNDVRLLDEAPHLGDYQSSWPVWCRMFEAAADTGVVVFS